MILDEIECNAPFAPEHEPTQNEIPIINQLFPEEQEPNVRLQLDSSIVIDPEYINPIVVVETGRKRSINNKKKDKQLKKKIVYLLLMKFAVPIKIFLKKK